MAPRLHSGIISAALPLLLPPVVAVLGIIATAFVIRTRYRVRHSLYTSVRATRTRHVEEARRRALAAAAPGGKGVASAAESVVETAFGLISLAAALGLVLMGVLLAIGARG